MYDCKHEGNRFRNISHGAQQDIFCGSISLCCPFFPFPRPFSLLPRSMSLPPTPWHLWEGTWKISFLLGPYPCQVPDWLERVWKIRFIHVPGPPYDFACLREPAYISSDKFLTALTGEIMRIIGIIVAASSLPRIDSAFLCDRKCSEDERRCLSLAREETKHGRVL